MIDKKLNLLMEKVRNGRIPDDALIATKKEVDFLLKLLMVLEKEVNKK